ncbi:YdcH family protein [Paraherbaspirillum soli]|uniref:YdcH family protein n=1 Tax=Paraherbaspirillum soli TaxID=631222 RepID=A0ABW0M7Q8_9BURK
MTMTDREEILRRIIELEVEHRDLDAVIEVLTREVLHEELQLRRLKKRKLQLKDQITLLKMQLIPDIPA